MGMESFLQNFFMNMPIEAPKQASVDTKLQAFQDTLPTLNASVPSGFQDTFPAPNDNNSSGKGVAATYSPTSRQPSMGSPNQYSNTVGQWDNASIQPQSNSGGKGKGF